MTETDKSAEKYKNFKLPELDHLEVMVLARLSADEARHGSPGLGPMELHNRIGGHCPDVTYDDLFALVTNLAQRGYLVVTRLKLGFGRSDHRQALIETTPAGERALAEVVRFYEFVGRAINCTNEEE